MDPSAGDDLPLATLAINVSGALLLGLLIGALAAAMETGRRPSRLLRPFLGTGILGGYTTFSTFAVQANRLSSATAVTYLLLSVTGGLVAAALGARAGATLLGRPSAALPADPDLP